MNTSNKTQITVAIPPAKIQLKAKIVAECTDELSYAEIIFQEVDHGECRVIGVFVPWSDSVTDTSTGEDVTGPSTWISAQRIISKITHKESL